MAISSSIIGGKLRELLREDVDVDRYRLSVVADFEVAISVSGPAVSYSSFLSASS